MVPPLASCWGEAYSESRILTYIQVELVFYRKTKKTDAAILICTRTEISSIIHRQAELTPHEKTTPVIKKGPS